MPDDPTPTADERDTHGSPPDATTLAEAQRQVDGTIAALGGYWPPLANLARLLEECGELARAVNQAHGPKPLKPGEAQAALSDELGDALYVLLVLANSLHVDAAAALSGAIARAEQRAAERRGQPSS